MAIPKPPGPPMRGYSRVFTLAGLWAVLLQACTLQGYRVYGSCMEPNVRTGERLLGSPVPLIPGVRRGDVVVFRAPNRVGSALIKRVIGLPGDRVEIRQSRVYVNGKALDEPYCRLPWHDERPAEAVRPGQVFVLGDNRDNSNDSRFWGELPIANIQAKAWLRYWPPSRVGIVR